MLAALVVPAVTQRQAAGAPVSTGSWVPTANQPSRMVVAAVPLSDGKVLAAQYGQVCAWVCFESFDPQASAWLPVVPLVDERHHQFMNLVPLAERGHALAMLWADTTLVIPWYRYHGDRWVLLPQPGDERHSSRARNRAFTATLLNPPQCRQNPRPAAFADYPCGKVLIAGGGNGSGLDDNPPVKTPNSADLYSYDPDKPSDPGRINGTGAIPPERQGHNSGVAALLADGRVLVAGGIYNSSEYPNQKPQADIYDPRSGSWSPAADLLDFWINGQQRKAVRLHDGRVLLAGGPDAPTIFDPHGDDGVDGTIGSWETIAQCRGKATISGNDTGCGTPVVLADGTVLAVGSPGYPYSEGDPRPPAKAWTLDPAKLGQGWAEEAPPAIGAWTATLLAGDRCGPNCGNVLAAGGAGESAGSVGESQIFQMLRVDGLSDDEGPTCGGTEVTVRGSGLKDVRSVSFGAVPVPKAAFVNVDERGRSITLRAPRNLPGPVPVTVTTAGGATAVAPAPFMYVRPDPAAVSVSPREGPVAGGTPVEIDIGGNYAAGCVRSVSFGDTTFEHPGSPTGIITVTSPRGAPEQTVRVQVGVDAGLPDPEGTLVPSQPQSPGSDQFTYLGLPLITGFDPPRAPAMGGVEVAIAGTGLERVTTVRFGDVQATWFRVDSATRLTAMAPPGDPGAVPVTVVSANRGTPATTTAFTYHPGITGVFPPTGPQGGGTQVLIAGRGLAGVSEVRFGDAAALDFVVRSDTEVVAVAPPHAVAEAVPVRLVASGLPSLPEDVTFTYGAAGLAPGSRPGGATAAGPSVQNTPPPQAAPPGGTGSPAPLNAPVPGASVAPTPAQVPAQSPSVAAVPIVVPGPAPVAASAQAVSGSGQAGLGDEEERQAARGSTRHAMGAAQVGLGLAAAGAGACFSWLALTRRAPARRHRRATRPSRAY